jgi:long-chain fatty acid transport protein
MAKKINFTSGIRTLTVGVLAMSYGTGAMAVNGVELSSIGVKSAGMSGTSIALPQDAAAAANNPAGMGLIGSRVDVGVQLLEPLMNYQDGSSNNQLHSGRIYAIPEGGFNYQVTQRTTLGVSVFGAGGAVNYGRPALPIPGAGTARASLQTIIVAPTASYKLDDHNIFGVSVALAYQRFMAEGAIVPAPGNTLQALPTHGYSNAYGYGARIGYIWQPTPDFTFGASYASRIRMSKPAGYEDDLLAAGGGRIDVPQQYGLGIAYKLTPTVTFAADVKHMDNADTILGSSQGFSWNNENIYRFGIAWDVNSKWTLRSGYTHGTEPFSSPVVAQNILAPLPVAKAVSIGATYRIDEVNEISGAFEYGFPTTVTGSGASTGFNVEARTEVFGLSFGHRF